MRGHFLPVLITAMILIVSAAELYSQQAGPYRLSWKRQGMVIGAGTAIVIGDLILSNRISPLSANDVASLDPSMVWVIDRSAINRYDLRAALRSDVGMFGALGLAVSSGLILPTTTGARSHYLEQVGTLSLLWMEINVLNAFGTDLVKNAFRRTRPFAYNPSTPIEDKLDIDARKSFFSGHTSITAANAFFAAKVFSDYYPNSRLKPLVWGAAAAIPAWVGVERYLAGKHFPSDILIGYAFGAALGYLVPQLHLPAGSRFHQQRGMSFQLYPVVLTSGSGAGATLQF